jgi:hypothetical protein
MNTISPSATTEPVDLKRSLNISTNQEARSNSAHQARARLIEKYIQEGDDSALDKLIRLNKLTKAENIPLTDKQRQVLQNELKASKESAANARERVGANPEKLAAIDTMEKRVNTIYGVAINQSVQKP